MTADEAYAWQFSALLTDDSVILCPECQIWSRLANWTETEVGCEACGSHDAMRCPECGHAFDHVWSPTFEVKRL